jgi:hypothetical protein
MHRRVLPSQLPVSAVAVERQAVHAFWGVHIKCHSHTHAHTVHSSGCYADRRCYCNHRHSTAIWCLSWMEHIMPAV